MHYVYYNNATTYTFVTFHGKPNFRVTLSKVSHDAFKRDRKIICERGKKGKGSKEKKKKIKGVN